MSDPFNPNSATNIIFYAVIGFLVISMVLLIFSNAYILSTHTDSSKIPSIKGDFAIKTSQQISIISKCGDSKKELCVFNNIRNIEDAINHCNINSQICNAFSYSPLIEQLSYINQHTLNNGTDNVYIRQIPTIIN